MIKSLVALVFLFVPFVAAADVVRTSSFNEVWSVVEDQQVPSRLNEQEETLLSEYRHGGYPQYEITLSRFFERTRFGFQEILGKATKRTLREHIDFYPKIDKLLHSNGICFSGVWTIDKESPYSGLFATDAKLKLIARASTTLGGTKVGEKRGAAFALKLFPGESDDSQVVTQNVFVIDVLAGRLMANFTDVAMTNQPDFGFSFNFPLGLHVIKKFLAADSDPGFRPISHLAAVSADGLKVDAARSPKWIKLEPHYSNQIVKRHDFRDELRATARLKPLRYDILVKSSDRDFKSTKGWQRIGHVVLESPTISYGCDRQLHFPHPRIDK